MWFYIAKNVKSAIMRDEGDIMIIKSISHYRNELICHEHSSHTFPEDKYFSMHTHDICEIIYLNSGNASAIIDGNIYKIPKDSLVIFRADVPHRIRIDGSASPYERHNILFDENKLANGIFHKLPKDVALIDCSGKSRIKELFGKIDYYYKKFKNEDMDVLIPNVIEEILYNTYLEHDESIDNKTILHPVVSVAVEYINKHYTDDISIDDISVKMHITKSHLHHLFNEYLNISPKKYINLKRLTKAQKMIKAGEKPSRIYQECGFSEYSTFFRNYSSHFGYVPSQREEIEKEIQINL